jgi:transposase
VEDLEFRLNQNSQNSHRPPSSDGLKKQPALPKQKQKSGGQAGHKGNTLKMVEQADEVEELKPAHCQHCHHTFDSSTGFILKSRRQQFDLPQIRLRSKEFRSYLCQCPRCGASNEGAYPPGVNAPVQYGSGVRSLVTLLHQNGCMSVAKVQQLFEDLFGAPLNEATILGSQQDAAQRLAQEQQYIKDQLLASPVCHADESGVRVEGKGHWLHTQGNALFTHQFVHKKRGSKAHEAHLSILPRYKGWLIHDCYAFYFKFVRAKHGICGAHLLRELQALTEAGSTWAGKFHRFLLTLYEKTKQGTAKLSSEKQTETLATFDQLIWEGYREEPPAQRPAGRRGKPRCSKGRNLLNRLDCYRQAVLAFAWHKCVPFTNNLAERDIRPAKSKLKVAGCFRTMNGAQNYACIHSFISTVRKHQLNPFKELRNIFEGNTPSYHFTST